MQGEMRSRILGVMLLIFGIALAVVTWYMKRNDGSFDVRLAVVGPLLVVMGLQSAIEAPPLPVRKLSLFGWAALVVGVLFGLLNWYLLDHN